MKNQAKNNPANKLNSFLFDGKRVKTWMTKEQYSNAKRISDSFKEPVKEQFKMSGDTTKIQNMRTPLHLFPSFARKEMDEQGTPFLSNCSYKEKKCGCKIVGNGTLHHPLEIEFCSKHKSAISI